MTKTKKGKTTEGHYYSFNASKPGRSQLQRHRTKKEAINSAIEITSGKKRSAIFGTQKKPGYSIMGLKQLSKNEINAAFSQARIEPHEETEHRPDHYYVFCYTQGRKIPGTDTTDPNEAAQYRNDHILQYPDHNATVIAVVG